MTAEKITKKNDAKKTKDEKINEAKETADMVMEKLHEGVTEIEKMIKVAKEKYEKTDEKTKHRLLAGVAGAAALLGTVIGINAIKNKGKK